MNKLRRVLVMLELETNVPFPELKDAAWWELGFPPKATVHINQVQVNVQTKKAPNKKKVRKRK